MSNGGRLFVKTTNEKSEIRIEIADDGKGIEERDLKKILTRFIQPNPPEAVPD
jgi:signal transduction histidine kinase